MIYYARTHFNCKRMHDATHKIAFWLMWTMNDQLFGTRSMHPVSHIFIIACHHSHDAIKRSTCWWKTNKSSNWMNVLILWSRKWHLTNPLAMEANACVPVSSDTYWCCWTVKHNALLYAVQSCGTSTYCAEHRRIFFVVIPIDRSHQMIIFCSAIQSRFGLLFLSQLILNVFGHCMPSAVWAIIISDEAKKEKWIMRVRLLLVYFEWKSAIVFGVKTALKWRNAE